MSNLLDAVFTAAETAVKNLITELIADVQEHKEIDFNKLEGQTLREKHTSLMKAMSLSRTPSLRYILTLPEIAAFMLLDKYKSKRTDINGIYKCGCIMDHEVYSCSLMPLPASYIIEDVENQMRIVDAFKLKYYLEN